MDEYDQSVDGIPSVTTSQVDEDPYAARTHGTIAVKDDTANQSVSVCIDHEDRPHVN